MQTTTGQRSGLIHTEEVTGSIPVMPTQLSGQSRSCSWPFVILVQLRAAAGSEGLRPELVHQAGLEAVVSSPPADCDQSRMLSGFPDDVHASYVDINWDVRAVSGQFGLEPAQ